MKMKDLSSLMNCEIRGNPETLIRGISQDSRKVSPGDLFFALPGSKAHGKAFIEEAWKKGAVAILCEKGEEIPLGSEKNWILVSDAREAMGKISSAFYGHPTEKLKVVGITGTNGKTTTSYITHSIFHTAGYPGALLGTVQYKVGEKIYPAPNTTPDSHTIHQLASQALEEGMKSLVMEVSSHALAQKRVEAVDFDCAVFTNLSGDHLDYHHTLENYLESKSLLFQSLGPQKVALLNGDDPASLQIAKKTSAPTFLYGIRNPQAHFRAENIELKLGHTSFILQGPSFALPIKTSLIGLHNVYNCLAAAGCTSMLGIHPGMIQSGIESLSGVPGRLEAVPNDRGIFVFVDYAHTDDAMENILSYLHKIKTNRIITVFGCGGNRDRTKRPRMGKVAEKWSDWVVVTSDNPRKEEPECIIQEIEKGLSSSHYEKITDRKQAIAHALEIAREGDIVLIAGKGHEDYQEGKDGKIWFDDRVIARQLLEKRAA